MRVQAHLEDVVTAIIAEVHGVEQAALVRPTQDARHGDYQINGAMPLAKVLKKPPRSIAEPILEKLRTRPEIREANVAGPGFINLVLEDDWLVSVVEKDLADRERDGVERVAEPETIVVDFSSPNVAKQMHVGHLRSTIIGAAIVRLLRFVGHRVIADNHLGDWGTQFGLLLAALADEGRAALDADDPIAALDALYKRANERADNDPAFAERGRLVLAELQSGDPEKRARWEELVRVTRKSLDEIYGRLRVAFDEWLGESAYNPMLPAVVDLLLEKGLAREDDGAICVFFDSIEDAPPDLRAQKVPFIVRKRDGAFLYSTTDIATILHRRDHFRADASLYVVDNRQAPHFRQVFAIARLLGVDMKLEHVGFGTIMGLDGKPMKARDASGKTVALKTLLDEAEERARTRIREEEELRVPEEDIPGVARAVGIGAVKWADLSQNRTSDYQFDWDKMISFKGNAGPYMQMQYARVRSILRKGEVEESECAGPIRISTPEERALVVSLIGFSDAIHFAAAGSFPHFVCDHLHSIARSFASFYNRCPVLDAEPPVRASRLALAALTARQLRRGLELLGIDVVERM
jgi:arginyl-tRNA synthetase